VRHVRMLGLCLVAALALGAYAVSSASALEWGKCAEQAGGNYTGPNCTKAEKAKPKGTGTYEWRKASQVIEERLAESKPANIPFSGASVEGGGLLTTDVRECSVTTEEGSEAIRTTRQGCEEAGGTEYAVPNNEEGEPLFVECAAETNEGEAEGKNKVVNVEVTFTGCAALGLVPCSNTGEEGEIHSGPLKGKLGWISKASKEVGIVLEPQVKKAPFAAFECAGGVIEEGESFLSIVVGSGNKNEGAEYAQGEQWPEGCNGAECQEGPTPTPAEEKHGGYHQIISPITPVNQMTSAFTQEFKISPLSPWNNEPKRLEKKHLSVLEDYLIPGEYFGEEGSSMWTSAGEEITNVNTPEEEGEIKA
jgi:hypothetical protein